MNSEPDDQDKTVELMRLFIERVDKLRNSSYIKGIVDAGGLKLKIKGDMATKTVQFDHTPINPEHLDAFLFTLRLFIQQKDSISIKRIGSMISSLKVSKEPRDRFLKQQDYLNRFLNESSMMKTDGKPWKHEEVLRTVLYGYRAHLKTEQPEYQRYKEWNLNPFAPSYLTFIFHNILVTYMESLNVMANNCRLILDELNGQR